MRRSRGVTGRSILIVEDEPRLREMLIQGTREMGFSPTGAASAEQALRILARESFPVVIIDLNLPGATGLDALQTIRETWPDTQAIILTGFGDLESARRAIRLDVVDFLTKPCALGDLEVSIGRALARLEKLQPHALDPVIDAALDHEQQDVAQTSAPPAFAPREAISMEEVERQTILATLLKHGGNRAATAAALGISVRKLYYRLGEYQKKAPPGP